MIVSITCRHGTEARVGRNDIGRELMALSRYVSTITRAQAAFSKETHHRNSEDLVTCHLSIHMPNRRPIDIYEHQPSELQAFDKARERVVNQMTRSCSLKHHPIQPLLAELIEGDLTMKTLNLYPTTEVDDLAWPEKMTGLTMDSSALLFFTDFKKVKPLVIESTVSAVEVKRLMQKAHVRLKFVLNESGHFVGIISADDLIDRKIVQKVSEGSKRDDIALTELMTPKRDLKALDYHEVAKASISEVIGKLKDSGEQHCLVVDRDNHKIRGIFSASDISRKLQLPIDIQDKSSFYKVFSATA